MNSKKTDMAVSMAGQSLQRILLPIAVRLVLLELATRNCATRSGGERGCKSVGLQWPRIWHWLRPPQNSFHSYRFCADAVSLAQLMYSGGGREGLYGDYFADENFVGGKFYCLSASREGAPSVNQSISHKVIQKPLTPIQTPK